MTTKDYKLIAKHLHKVSLEADDGIHHEAYADCFSDVLNALGAAFTEDNDRFDSDTFDEAVYRGS